MMKTFNTMSLQKEDFKPINEKTINMYVCGPTGYNYIHIGNARSAIAFDTIRRYFEYRGYEVNYVSNFTDVDDKMIAAAAEQGITVPELADKYIDAFNEDTAPLNIKPATVRPRATEHIPEIIEFVEDLIKKGYAYESEGDVYFRAKKFKGYGILAHQDLAEMDVWMTVNWHVRKTQWTLLSGRVRTAMVPLLGTHLGVRDVLDGTSSAQ